MSCLRADEQLSFQTAANILALLVNETDLPEQIQGRDLMDLKKRDRYRGTHFSYFCIVLSSTLPCKDTENIIRLVQEHIQVYHSKTLHIPLVV